MSDAYGAYAGYLGLVTLAASSVYAGSYGSLPKQKRPATGSPGVKKGKTNDSDDEDEDSLQRLASEDVWIFPVMGSISLLGLYMAIKYFGKEIINLLMGWYLCFVALVSVSKCSVSLARLFFGTERWKRFEQTKLQISCTGSKDVFTLSWRTPTQFLIMLGAIPSILWTVNKDLRGSPMLTNILGLSLAHQAISTLRLDSFKAGSLLLSALFLYDIWWVFGTDVMVHVATNLDVPVKLMWPRNLFSGSTSYMMLGLGDIVVPGVFIALALRYDYDRFQKSQQGGTFTKPYFHAALAAYILGLVSTMAVLHVFQVAQPALLYLSPACIMAFYLTAAVRGELAAAWKWSDNPPEPFKPRDPNEEPSSDSSSDPVQLVHPAAAGNDKQMTSPGAHACRDGSRPRPKDLW